MKICIFPNDPLIAYYEKGEIKNRYFNPKNFFDEVHFITFSKKEIESSKVKKIVGDAKIVIHRLNKIQIKNRKKHLEEIIKIVSEINPAVIRAFNPLLEGWFAAQTAKKLNIPFLLSLHTQYDMNRKLAKRNNLKKFLALKYTEKFLESFVLKSANKIIIVYKIIEPYVKKHTNSRIEILYNKVDCERFSKGVKLSSFKEPLVISVGNLIRVKNHHILIDAFQNINANLLIIGRGELYQELHNQISKNKLENKIKIIESVPYEKINDYYKSATIFASAFNPEVESLPMPVMEALATGLPVVIPQNNEGLEDVALYCENSPESFEKNIKKLLENKELREKYSINAEKKAMEFDSKIAEEKEARIYTELINEFK